MRVLMVLAGTALALASIALLAGLLTGCATRSEGADAESLGGGNEHAEEATQVHARTDLLGDDHDHDEEGASDLDRPVEELFALRCEHEIPTVECDECRYEVGVVKVSEDLIEQGLIETAVVARRELSQPIELTGEVQFDERRLSRLAPSARARVRSVRAGLGDRAATGEILVELDCPDLAEAEAAYLEALAARRMADQALARHEALHNDRITSEREFDEARGGQEAACARAQAARLRLLRLGVAEEEVAGLESGGRSAAGVLLMRAPFAGEVVSIHAAPGEWVEEGTAVLLLADMSKLWIWVDLYERHLTAFDGRLAGGDAHAAPAPGADGSPTGSGRIPAEVLVRAYSNERFHGEIDFVERMMSEETRTIRGRVVIDNPDGRLKPGMFASVRVAIERGPAGLTVPAGAVLSDEGRDFAFVHVRDDYFLRRCVKTGRAVDGVVEIVDGLESGQTVAAAGAFLLKSDVLREKMGAGCAD